MLILGIETSCDETAAAVLKDTAVLSNVVASQVKLHAKTFGVVPEVAARAHTEKIMPVIEKALKDAKVSQKEIDVISVTAGPGLVPALIIGVTAAKTLSFLLKKPLVAANHLEGHILASLEMSELSLPCHSEESRNTAGRRRIPTQNIIDSGILCFAQDDRKKTLAWDKKRFPMVALIVSGGHTQLVLVKDYLKYELIGETRDDAAGEAFDKVAKLLGLGYPGGPIISQLAEKGDPTLYSLPRPMIKHKSFDFSFSGLKTAVLYLYRKGKIKKKDIPDLCASFQEAVVNVLVDKTIRAARAKSAQGIILAGGVSANKRLREKMEKAIKKELGDFPLFVAPPALCTDNAVMTGLCGYYHARAKDFASWRTLEPNPNMEL